MNMPTRFGSNWLRGFRLRREELNVKVIDDTTDDDRRQVKVS